MPAFAHQEKLQMDQSINLKKIFFNKNKFFIEPFEIEFFK